MDGFLSAYNLADEHDDFLASAPKAVASYAWIDNYCGPKPLDEVIQAVVALKKELQSRSQSGKNDGFSMRQFLLATAAAIASRTAQAMANVFRVNEMRAIVCSELVTLLISMACAQAQQCTPNHELYRLVPEHRAIMLDGGEIKRVMFVDEKDERLTSWKPGHNITYCPDENKVINTTVNSVATLFSEFAAPSCKTLLISNAIDRSLKTAWDYANRPSGDPNAFVTEAKRSLGWYYEVCTDHGEGSFASFANEDFKDFLNVAASLTSINMAIDDRANESTYKARAAQYEKWRSDLYAAEGKKSFVQRTWERFTASH